MRLLASLLLILALPAGIPGAQAAEKVEADQLVLAIAPKESAWKGKLYRFERQAGGPWKRVGDPIECYFGKNGLAWGIGLHPPQEGPTKREGDWKTPSGRFKIGTVLGNFPALPEPNRGWPYHEKTPNDAWVGDSRVPDWYNRLYTHRPGTTKPSWFEKEKFNLGSDTYKWLVLVEHNYPDATPYKGSAIFFHQRRTQSNGSPKPTAGCTSMRPEHLQTMMRWLDPQLGAEYVVLPEADYKRVWKAWGLPAPDQL